ncbi:MAG: hypothetical protein PHI40_06415 [Caldisericia bacterium]|nr:hypothetical protein [Caldisericia bacterium]MDD4615020.1 hypothetical protein [Caldisericia bacterium]
MKQAVSLFYAHQYIYQFENHVVNLNERVAQRNDTQLVQRRHQGNAHMPMVERYSRKIKDNQS